MAPDTSPLAENLRAIADGQPMQERLADGAWQDATHRRALFVIGHGYCTSVRVKVETLTINGKEFPIPMRKEPEKGSTYYALAVDQSKGYKTLNWSGHVIEKMWLRDGLCQATEKGIIACAEAVFSPLKALA